MHTRTCIQVCKFLEMISKDGVFCPLRPDLPLRWPCWLHLYATLCSPL